MTSVAYGFAMPVSRGVLTPPGFPAWLPLIGGGNPPSSYADFAGGRYWCGHSQWLTSEDASAYFSAAGYSFTRATVASRMRSDGKLEAVASGVLRFDHDSGSLAATGLRIEGQRTNLVQQTEAFDNAYWSKQSVSVTANGATAPDGNMTADAHMEDASNSKHSLYRAGSPLAATGICTWSVFVAPALRNWTQIYIFDNPVVTERWANFDVANGVVGYSQNISGSRLQKFQNGWYRPSIGGLLTSGSGNVQILSASANVNGAGPGFQGLSAASLYIWGGQLELAPFVSTYVPATTASATRNADVLVRSDMGVSSLTKFVTGRTPPGVGSEQVRWSRDDGSAANRIRVLYKSDGHLHVSVTAGGVDQADLDLGAVAFDADFRLALRAASNDFAASLNGGVVVTDASGTMPSGLTNERIGSGLSAGNEWFSTCAIDAEWQNKLATDAELRALTA